MNYRPAAICVDFDDDARVAAAAGRRRSTVDVDDVGDDGDNSDDDAVVVGASTQRVCASPVDLLRALPAASRAADDVTATSARTLMTMQSPARCCRTRGVQRRWNTHVATVPVASDVACTCAAGWMSAEYSPPTHSFPAPPPPVPRRLRTVPTDRRRRIDDAYSTSCSVDAGDVEPAASAQTRHFDCFRFCFSPPRSAEPEQKTTGTTELVGLTTVCRCSALVDTGSGNRNNRHDELSSKHTRVRRRRHVSHVLIACIVALPVTCLGLLALFLLVSPLYKSPSGKL